MTSNRTMVFAGVSTLIQAVCQLTLTSLGIAQYFCVIDFLRGWPILIYLKILYFHNPDVCGFRINIGEAIDSIADQAFVLQTEVAFTAFRTLIINAISLGLSIPWLITSVIMMRGGAKDKQTKCIRRPWIMVTALVSALDLVAGVTYANDSFHTRTLSDIMEFIGSIASGIGSTNLDTSWAAWIMVLLYSRFVILFILNVFLVIMVILDYKAKNDPAGDLIHVEDPSPVVAVPLTPAAPTQVVSTAVQASSPAPPTPHAAPQDHISDADEDIASLPSERITTRIPRAGLSRSFRTMKAFLFRKWSTSDVQSRDIQTREIPLKELNTRTNIESPETSPERSPRPHYYDDKKRTVNFPQSLMSLPQRLENIIAEQQRRLDRAVIDTSGRTSPPRASQSLPQLASTSNQTDAKGRRGTTAELQGQLPWAYIPAPANRMRDQLPPDEDLPPVPLPDYTAFQSDRKASVHRAASSLSSLTQKKDYTTTRPRRTPFNQFDVLY